MKICILCHTANPYHLARYCALTKVFQDLTIVEVAAKQTLYPWQPDKTTLPFVMKTLFHRAFEEIPQQDQVHAVQQFLQACQPLVVVSVGYSDAVMRTTARWGKANGVSIMVTDSWAGDRRRYWIKERAKSILVQRLFDAAFMPGWRGYEYARSLGFPEGQIWRGVSVVDNEHFAKYTERIQGSAETMRKTLGLPERYFLCVARHSPEKNLAGLIRAFAGYRKYGGCWDLVIIGSGPQTNALRVLSKEVGGDSVHLVEWQQYNELPAYYALASCFVLPSISEPWGLVVNEAMACGLPVLVSRKAGCMPELCHRGINGFDFDPHDVGGLAELMLRMSSGKVDLAAMGEASRRIIANFTPETWAAALADCIRTTVRRKCG